MLVEMETGTADAACSNPYILTLEEGDTEGAALEEPLEANYARSQGYL